MKSKRLVFSFLTILLGIVQVWLVVMLSKAAQNADLERLRVDYQTDWF